MNPTPFVLILVASFAMVAAPFALGSLHPEASADTPVQTAAGPVPDTAVDYTLSRPAREVAASTESPADVTSRERINPLADEPDGGNRGTWNRQSVLADPLIPPPTGGARTPTLDFDFAGVGNPTACGGCTPPDTIGDVGPNHYIQMVNATKVAIFDKSGTSLTAPFNLGNLWPSGTCASNAGDPVVLYDPLADRWLLSQFADPNHMCIAISQTPDPLGSYHLYTFNVGSFPDYFKFGVWPDAYYMSANENTYTAYAFNRAKMLVGDQTANFVKFTGQTNFLLPADLDGSTPPPAGSPGLFYTFKDNSFHGGADRIEVFALDVNFANPGLSTFTMVANLPIAPFTYTVCGFFNFNCVRQLGTNQRVDAVSEWPMHRFPYRNFGSHETLVGTFTVGGGNGNVGAAIRWFELRKTGGSWTLFQQGTHDPDDGHDRFMGSIAMDGGGNIALGYSVSSNLLNPGIRYATRAPGDPAGALQPEAVLINGGGSQTGSNRWGDYSAMSVDPADDCTFWYTNEYYPVNAANSWKTRVGVFGVDCGGTPGADLAVTKTDSPDPVSAGANITYTIGASNVGTAAATNVALTDATPANTTFQSVSAPRGWACTKPAVGGTGPVTCTKGTLEPGASAALMLIVKVNQGTPGGTDISNTASISSGEPDPAPGNNSASATTTVAGGAGPTISIANAQITENRTDLVFTLSLSAPSTQTVRVLATTANNTATAPSDYQAKTATVTFQPGQTSRPFAVSIKEDALVEGTERFFVNLSNAVNATIADGQAVGSILDDD